MWSYSGNPLKAALQQFPDRLVLRHERRPGRSPQAWDFTSGRVALSSPERERLWVHSVLGRRAEVSFEHGKFAVSAKTPKGRCLVGSW